MPGVFRAAIACIFMVILTACSGSPPTAPRPSTPARYTNCVIPRISGAYTQPYVFFNGGVTMAVNAVCTWSLESTGAGTVIAPVSPAEVEDHAMVRAVRDRKPVYAMEFAGTRPPNFDRRHQYNWGNILVGVVLVRGVPRLPTSLTPLQNAAPKATVRLFQAMPAFRGGILELTYGSHHSYYLVPGTTAKPSRTSLLS